MAEHTNSYAKDEMAYYATLRAQFKVALNGIEHLLGKENELSQQYEGTLATHKQKMKGLEVGTTKLEESGNTHSTAMELIASSHIAPDVEYFQIVLDVKTARHSEL